MNAVLFSSLWPGHHRTGSNKFTDMSCCGVIITFFNHFISQFQRTQRLVKWIGSYATVGFYMVCPFRPPPATWLQLQRHELLRCYHFIYATHFISLFQRTQRLVRSKLSYGSVVFSMASPTPTSCLCWRVAQKTNYLSYASLSPMRETLKSSCRDARYQS